MYSMTLADGVQFSIDVDYTCQDNDDNTLNIDIHKIEIVFDRIGSVDISTQFTHEMLNVLRRQIAYYHCNPK